VTVPGASSGGLDALTAGEVVDTLLLRAGFNTTMVVAGTMLLGIAAGVTGVFAMLRKRSLMTDALSHATLPGIALAFLFAPLIGLSSRSLPVLLLGAAATGVFGVGCVQGLLRATRLREDAAIGIVLSVFFGAGIVVMSYIQVNAPAGSAGLNGFIFGQAAAMRAADVALMGAIAVVAIVACVLLLKEFALVCFNDSFARVDGWPVSVIDFAMMALVVMVTIAGLQAVGLILVVALLIVPPVAARFWTERLWLLVVLAGVIGGLSGYLGSVLSALLPRMPAGAVIVLAAGAMFVVSLLFAPSRGVLARGLRGLRLRMRLACDHVVESAHDEGVERLDREAMRRLAARHGWASWFGLVVERWLVWSGLASRSGGVVVLSERGVERGRRVSRNHTLWEQYLISYAEIAPSHVDWSVDQVEHVLSEELIRELERGLTARGAVFPSGEGVAR
jgi:manganese/zinc/iron transport system permease protein